MSAINNYFRKKAVPSEAMKTKMAEFMAGYKRRVADAKATLTEGKQPFTFDNYHLIAGKALKESEEPSIIHFAHLYLILCWNLMARSCSVATIKYNHITWMNDSLLITLPRHKGDQEGANSYPRHVFANPNDPTVCPVLSLGIHLFCTAYRVQGKKQI